MHETTPGFDRKNAWLYRTATATISCLAIVLVSLLLGDKADRNSASRTIKIKLSW